MSRFQNDMLRRSFRAFDPVPPHASQVFDRPWRSMDWSHTYHNNLLTTLNNVQYVDLLRSPDTFEVNPLRILLHGPVGSGKSSFINSVDSALKGRNSIRAPTNSTLEGGSFTLECKTYKLSKGTAGSYYPFTFTDIMGIFSAGGIQTDDIIKVLNGHIRNNYTFNPVKAISERDPSYNSNPGLKDKIHCLVSVLPNTISGLPEDIIKQMKVVRSSARHLGIPQAVIVTKVDEACPLVKESLKKVYTSKKIKEKIEECSVRLGVPVNCIFPVKNYHEERTTNTTTNILILDALLNIVNFASDYVNDQAEYDYP